MEEFKEIEAEETNFERKVQRIAVMKEKAIEDWGPYLIKDIYTDKGEVGRFFNEWTERNEQLILDFFTRARRDGDVRADLKPEVILFLLRYTREIYNNPGFDAMVPEPKERMKILFNFFYYGVMTKKGKNKNAG